ncbi:hypothetical protein [Paenibacillus sp.]|uniref:hypothetical protein n=1 Tax=Paenibacillus sp. TaxID=58172 RepID=UPI0028B132FA|nr:hypothetical protein [Paenibacillus sp.]
MNNKDLFKTIGYVDGNLVEQANIARRTNKKVYAKWGSLAACAALVLGVVIYNSPLAPSVTSPQITQQTPVSAPTGIRKILNYNGYRYAFVGDGAQYKFTGVKPEKSLGTLDYDINQEIGKDDGDNYVEKDYSSTFAVGGKLYEIPTYPSHFRIAVKYEEEYYLAEVVAKVNDSAITAKEYLDMSNLKEHAKDIHVLNHVGNDMLKKMTDHASVESIIDGLYSAKTADLSNKEYEAIAEAQSQGKPYQLKFNLKDGTYMAMYIIPELRVVSMGDAYYHLPDTFFDQSGELFSGLKQEVLPLY